MSDTFIVFTFALVVLVALIAGLCRLVRLWNSPDGERYLRMKAHGPFVPLSAEDIAEDERRRKERRDE